MKPPITTRRLLEPILGTFRTTAFGQRLLYAYRSRVDPEFARVLKDGTRMERFEYIFEKGKWGATETRSGVGSSRRATQGLRQQLVALAEEEGVATVFDAGCGDFNWMREVDYPWEYTGGDIVPGLVDDLNARFGSKQRRFIVFDVVEDLPPRVDMIICRDVLFHLPNADVQRALANFKSSGSGLLLLTTDASRTGNFDIEAGGQRRLNLERAPFLLPEARTYLRDDGVVPGRRMALYDLPNLEI